MIGFWHASTSRSLAIYRISSGITSIAITMKNIIHSPVGTSLYLAGGFSTPGALCKPVRSTPGAPCSLIPHRIDQERVNLRPLTELVISPRCPRMPRSHLRDQVQVIAVGLG